MQPSSPHLPAFFNAPILRCPSAAVRAIVHELNCFVQSNDRNISIFFFHTAFVVGHRRPASHACYDAVHAVLGHQLTH